MLRIEGNKTLVYCDIEDCEEYSGVGGDASIGVARLRRLGWYIKRIGRKTRTCLCPAHGRPLYEALWQRKRDNLSLTFSKKESRR